MYATRQQKGHQQDENKQEEPKPPAGKGKAPPPPPVNNRRTLGDISNLIIGLPAPGNAIKDGSTEPTNAAKKIPAASRPMTRSFEAQLASNKNSESSALSILPARETEDSKNEAANKPDDPNGWGTKQRRTARLKDSAGNIQGNPKVPQADPSGTVSDAKPSGEAGVHPGHPARMKALLNNRSGKVVAAKERRGRTLTSTLTARSEAACGGSLSTKNAEPLPNIDEGDVGNQLAVVDYIEDIYSFYRKTEGQSCVPADYMSKHTEINDKMRAILIDWLIEVHLKFKLMPETLFLMVNVLDRFLSLRTAARKNLQLVGMAAMLVASKYEEIWAPEVKDFIAISDNTYTRQQMLDMEKHMLNTLKFNLTVPTPYVFLVRFLKAAQSDEKMYMMAFFLVELSLLEYKMVKYKPSIIAAAAVYTAQCVLHKAPNWTTALLLHSGYKQEELKDISSALVLLHKKANTGNLTVVHRKYSLPKFHSVSELTPATFLIEASETES